ARSTTPASPRRVPRALTRSDLHELLRLVVEELVHLGGVGLRETVDLVLELVEVVLGDLAVGDELVGELVRVAAEVADRDPLRLGELLRALHELLPPLLGERGHDQPDQLAVVLRRDPELALEER